MKLEAVEAIEATLTERMGEYFRPGTYSGSSWRLNPADLARVVGEMFADDLARMLNEAVPDDDDWYYALQSRLSARIAELHGEGKDRAGG